MSLPFVQTITPNSTGNVSDATAALANPYAFDWMQSPPTAAWKVDGLGSTTGTWSVEYTLDDVNAVASPTWTQVVPANQTINGIGVINFPVRFLRVNFSTGPVGGNCTFTVLQGQSSR